MLTFIISQKGSFLKALSKKFSVRINIENAKDMPMVERDEGVCIIKGKLNKVQYTSVFILRRAYEFTQQRHETYTDQIKMLIPNNFVTKLIGAKGSMIRELAKKSMGAQIKILSDRKSERELQECIVTVAGSLANRQDAACFILEQIEKFKVGGYDYDPKVNPDDNSREKIRYTKKDARRPASSS